MRRSLVLPVLALFLATAASADTTLSTSSFVASATQDVWCNVTNLGTKPVTVTMEHVNIDGMVLMTGTLEIVPQGSDSTSMDGAGLVRCRFTGKFSRKSVRAVAFLLDGGTVLSVPAE